MSKLKMLFHHLVMVWPFLVVILWLGSLLINGSTLPIDDIGAHQFWAGVVIAQHLPVLICPYNAYIRVQAAIGLLIWIVFWLDEISAFAQSFAELTYIVIATFAAYIYGRTPLTRANGQQMRNILKMHTPNYGENLSPHFSDATKNTMYKQQRNA